MQRRSVPEVIMITRIIIIVFCVSTIQCRIVNQTEVLKFVNDFFDFKIKENPGLASSYGINKYQNLVEEWNDVAFQRRINKSEEFLLRVKDYLAETLEKKEDELTLKIMEHSLEKFLSGSKYMNYTKTLNVDLASIKTGVTVTNPIDTEEELFFWHQQIVEYQQVFTDQLALLDEGIQTELTPAKTTCEYVLNLYKDAVGESFDGSLLSNLILI
ncbi:hypothetical protein EB796_004221 [Bugula neritina]|uniref:Uncharacterized protein n=1 Tax=Bugula neritina TaxID=10212 RepID=A0A7J7KHT6_BUGNE|nr:hypothetical protein EB796_004221 [Bugula neritina]